MKLRDAIDLFQATRGITGRRAVRESTSRGYVSDVRQFCTYMHNPDIVLIKAFDCEEFLRDMEGAGLSSNNSRNKVAALRRFFRFLKRRGYSVLDPDDIPIPVKEHKFVRVATDEDIAKVLEVLPENSDDESIIRNRALLLFLRDTGVRLGEMIAVNVNDLDLEKQKVVVKTSKYNRSMLPFRTVYWFDDCHRSLLKWLSVREQLKKKLVFKTPDALFIGINKNRYGMRLGRSGVDLALRKASGYAGVQTINPHSLRHRKGHKLSESGANNSIISGVLGHASLSSSFIYTMMHDREIEKVARVFGNENVLKS